MDVGGFVVGRTGKGSKGFLGEQLKGIEWGFWERKSSKSLARGDFITSDIFGGFSPKSNWQKKLLFVQTDRETLRFPRQVLNFKMNIDHLVYHDIKCGSARYDFIGKRYIYDQFI